MMTVLGIVIFFAGILFSVFWHELGHFVTARWFGIKVPEFFVGFGKTIFSRRRGETEFGIKAIPLGGYIRMIGMIPPVKEGELLGRSRRTGPFQGLVDDVRAQSAQEVSPEDVDRQFWMRAPWKRIVVMFAGPFMNLVLAVFLVGVQLMGIGTLSGINTTVQAVSQCVLPASAPSAQCPAGAPPTPAAAAGFQPGDRIVSFAGVAVGEGDWSRLQETIRAATGTVDVTVDRAGQLVDLRPTLITTELPSLTGDGTTVQASFLGLTPQTFYVQQGPGVVVDQIGAYVGRTGEAIAQLPSRVPGLFGSVFLGEQRDVEGPVGIVGASRIGGEILAQNIPLRAELSLLLNLLAAVNISLFLFNLLPIPPLDGGQIFPAIWESVRRRIARLRGKPDPGPVDIARLMPVAYVVAMIFIAWSALLFVADIINPIKVF